LRILREMIHPTTPTFTTTPQPINQGFAGLQTPRFPTNCAQGLMPEEDEHPTEDDGDSGTVCVTQIFGNSLGTLLAPNPIVSWSRK
jgi:hypothetical protein